MNFFLKTVLTPLFLSLSFATILDAAHESKQGSNAVKERMLRKRIQALEGEIEDKKLLAHTHERIYGQPLPQKVEAPVTVVSTPDTAPVMTESTQPQSLENVLQNVSIKEENLPPVVKKEAEENESWTDKIGDAIDDIFDGNEDEDKNKNKKENPEDQKPPEKIITPQEELYKQARHYLTQQRIDLAKPLLEDVVAKYKGTPEEVLSRFWLGEMMLRRRNFAGASIAYGQSYGAYKKLKASKEFAELSFHDEEERLPEILYKLSFSLSRIKKKNDACLALKQMQKEFKGTTSTLKTLQGQLRSQLKCT